MQIVIDIPEEVYKASQIIDITYDDVIQIPLKCIANGTPLLKGHGRLIDADDLLDNTCIDEIPTIIEAERSDEE